VAMAIFSPAISRLMFAHDGSSKRAWLDVANMARSPLFFFLLFLKRPSPRNYIYVPLYRAAPWRAQTDGSALPFSFFFFFPFQRSGYRKEGEEIKAAAKTCARSIAILLFFSLPPFSFPFFFFFFGKGF